MKRGDYDVPAVEEWEMRARSCLISSSVKVVCYEPEMRRRKKKTTTMMMMTMKRMPKVRNFHPCP